MTPDQRFAVLMTLLGAALAAIGWLLKSVLGATAQWGRTGERLEQAGNKIEDLSQDIRDLMNAKERDHTRIETRIDRVESRVERHETWHSEH